jgi:hypothetical protein
MILKIKNNIKIEDDKLIIDGIEYNIIIKKIGNLKKLNKFENLDIEVGRKEDIIESFENFDVLKKHKLEKIK